MIKKRSAIFAIGLVLGVCLAGVATAQAVFPKLVEVVNVPPNDVLNVRASPSGGARDLGDLANGAQVELLEQNGSWARILWQEGNGWIATRYTRAIRRPQLASGLPLDLHCGGTEPFWSLSLLKIGVSQLDGATYPIVSSGTSVNVANAAYYFRTTEQTGILRRAQCSDGMSDRTYGWQIDLVTGRGLKSGCCSSR